MDCYLCGASNPPDADFCGRCEGQLLSIGESADAQLDHGADVVEEIEPEVEAAPSGRKRRSIRSIEHSRLQAALGMGRDDDDDFDDDEDYLETVVPTVGTASNIPMIGTRTVPVAANKHTDSRSRLAYVLMTLLAMAVMWLGYLTLVQEDKPAGPDNLAFTESTLPMQTTTTTEVEVRPWTESEVLGKFGSAFVNVRLSDCPSEFDPKFNNEALEVRVVPGVAVDDYNVLLPGTEFGSADVAEIVTRFGFSEPARLTTLTNGSVVATTFKRLTRNLAVPTDPVGEALYYVSFDPEQNQAAVSQEPTEARVEVTVTDQGEAIEVRTDGSSGMLDVLTEVSEFRTELVDEENTYKKTKTSCDRTSFMIDPSLTATEESEADAP